MTLQLAQAQPQRVRSLSLFEPIPFHLLPDGDAGLAELHSVRRQVEASLKNDDARAGTACFIDYWSGAGAFSRMPEARQSTLIRWLPKTALDFQAVARERLHATAYRRIAAPTRLIAGRSGPRPARRLISTLAESCRTHAVMRSLPGTWPQLPILRWSIRSSKASFEASMPVACARQSAADGRPLFSNSHPS